VASLHIQDCVLLWSENMDIWLNSVDCRGANFYNPHTYAGVGVI